MKLLIVTQVIDKQHPILGFFHRWVEEFAKHCEQIQVICLQKGEYDLPPNVTVYSLGKEASKGRWTCLWRFLSLIFKLRHEYDNVFVHMNQIYVILGAPLWRLIHKKTGLWYAHGAVSTTLRAAVKLADVVFTSTPEGLRIETPKKVIVGQGIDTKIFTPALRSQHEVLELITVGRISTSKNIDTLLRACFFVKQAGIDFSFKIVGTPITKAEEEYLLHLKELVMELDLESRVVWVGGVSNHELPSVLQQSDIFIHDGATNSLDKTLLEAALCGCIVVSSNPAYQALTRGLAPEYLYQPGDSKRLAEIIIETKEVTESVTKIREFFKETFDISNLTANIINKY